jgi:hypothetical protein
MLDLSAWGDGCFVFRWNKDIDIKEPTQKAIIVYDQGREDLLLQVKYEGPLEEFGWLVPVPALPKVEKGSMEPFYELSQLTQRQLQPLTAGLSRGTGLGGQGHVEVIEIKTVGAYEVAILSADDAGGLGSWLQAHGYSVPAAGAAALDEYVRNSWFFVAAKIQLDRDVAFKLVSTTSPKDPAAQTAGRAALQKQMSSGELHPLKISFDSPRCIYPLKVSAFSGKPSKVSIYVLSSEPLLNKFILDQRLAKLSEEKRQNDLKSKQREQMGRIAMQNTRRLMAAWQMYQVAPPGRSGSRLPRDWSMDDLEAMIAEDEPVPPPMYSDESYFPGSFALLQMMEAAGWELRKSAKVLDRLQGKDWHLTYKTTAGPTATGGLGR